MQKHPLNPKQTEAVEHVEGPLLVLAGAGSGKTRVVTFRIAHLMQLGLLPSDILAVTFTNKAAGVMKDRIYALTGKHVLACTFHSLGARILRESISYFGYQPDFTIYDEDDSENLIKSCFDILQLKDEKGLLKSCKMYISSAKNELLSPKEAPSFSHEKVFADAYALYQAKLKESNAVDFDDLLYLTVKLLQENESARREYQSRWLFLLIDEYQDTNSAQHTLAKLLVEKHRNIFAVGDPDQSIYSWRGARYQNILNFSKDFPGAKVITLEQNYRSTSTILQAANALISHNQNRYEKNLWSDLGEGEKISIHIAQNEKKEAEFVMEKIGKHRLDQRISLDEMVIFYRTNAQSRIFEDALLARRIPYQMIGGLSFYQRKEIKDMIAFLRMVQSGADYLSFMRTINIPKKGLGLTTVKKIVDAASSKGISIFSFCEELASHPEAFPESKLSAKQREGFTGYIRLIQHLRGRLAEKAGVSALLSDILQRTKYVEYLKEDPESFEDRKENIAALISKAAEWEQEASDPALSAFLEELSLKSVRDEDRDQARIKLMTLHNGKGLEFDLVFIVGMEEDLLPHVNAKGSPESLEEERRLCYVGMTRAKKLLYLSAAFNRFLWGSPKLMQPSRFLREIPVQFLHNTSPVDMYAEEEFPSEDAPLEKGTRVLHKEFGTGTIQKAYHTSYGSTYDVFFEESATTRSLVAKYAKLRVL